MNDDKPAFRFGTLTLAFAGLGDMEDLGPKYESHRASADCRVDGIVEVSVDGALPHLVPRDDFGVLREWSIDGSRLKIATGRWRAEVALERGAVSRVVMRRWRAWEFDLLMGCLVQVMAPVYDRGIVFHGSSVLRAGRGYLFFAPSETGKSTVAQFSKDKGYSVLAEEMSFIGLSANGDGPTLHRLPIRERNELRCEGSRSAPLCGLFRLMQANSDRIEPLDRHEAVLELAGAAAIGARAPIVMDAALRSIDSLLGFVEPSRLCFTRSSRFWDVIETFETEAIGVEPS